MPRQTLGLLSLGVFVIILAVLLVAFGPSQAWDSMFSLILMLSGLWIMFLAGVRAKNPVKYGRGALSILIWGILLLAFGGSWYFNILTGGNIIYSVALFLIIVGLLAVTVALASTQKKQI